MCYTDPAATAPAHHCDNVCRVLPRTTCWTDLISQSYCVSESRRSKHIQNAAAVYPKLRRGCQTRVLERVIETKSFGHSLPINLLTIPPAFSAACWSAHFSRAKFIFRIILISGQYSMILSRFSWVPQTWSLKPA
jgi:hypothetical protein